MWKVGTAPSRRPLCGATHFTLPTWRSLALLHAVELGFLLRQLLHFIFKKMVKSLNVGMWNWSMVATFQAHPRDWPWDPHLWEDLLGSLAELDLVGLVLGLLL